MNAPYPLLRPLLLAALIPLALAACGRRGPLEPAPVAGAKPAAQAEPPQGAGVVVSPTGGTRRREPIKPGQGPFILDPLIQ